VASDIVSKEASTYAHLLAAMWEGAVEMAQETGRERYT